MRGLVLGLLMWACGAPAQEVAVKGPCTGVRLASGGLVTVVFADGEVTARLAGVALAEDRRTDLEAVLGRLPTQEGKLECRVDAARDPATVTVTYYAWQDKSGDVYQDLAETLVRMGLARKE